MSYQPFETGFQVRDKNFLRYPGYEYQNLSVQQKLFSNQTMALIQGKCMELLDGVEPTGKRILVQVETIADVMDAVWNTWKQQDIGDIYTIYNIPNGVNTDPYSQIIDQVIEYITRYVRDDYGMRIYNSKLTKWTTVLGDFNENGLRSHDVIKVQEKRPNPMEFNMNY